jgi:phosphoribosyl-ATP pyrophosphohydrolase
MIDGMPGYHVKDIPRGVLGTASKITEEALEFQDAIDQGCRVMAIQELADLYGAMQAYLMQFNLTMSDLARMSDVTTRAFQSGRRK